LPEPERQALVDLVTRRRQLVAMRTTEKLRRESLAPKLRPGLDAHLRWLAAATAELDADIDALVRKSALWRAETALLTSVPGVGPGTATTLLALLPELGCTPAKKLAALVGLAPVNHDSGTLRGRRHIQGGRAAVRPALYMATIAAIRCNPAIQRCHARLRAAGKPAKVAITACMHKLLRVLNAISRTNTPWRTA
jgi:transposase